MSDKYGNLTEEEFCNVLLELAHLFQFHTEDGNNRSNIDVISAVAEDVRKFSGPDLDAFLFALTARAFQSILVQSAHIQGKDLDQLAEELYGPKPM